LTDIEFRDGSLAEEPGASLIAAMRTEINELYPGFDLTADYMPAAGAADLSPPGGGFVVGYAGPEPVCCGGVKRLSADVCEIKRMYVVPERRGQGIARELLHALEELARRLGYPVARLDTGPRQVHARALYESEGYTAIDNFNGNPVASFWGEKRLA
jgi:GNAT superfamily N-acetyltransferase